MNFIVYTPLSETKRDFPSNLVTAFKSAESYEYCRNWQDIGEFTLVVPIDTPGIENVSDDMLLLVQDELNSDYLIITTIIDNGKNVTLKGYDLKVMLKWRITLFPEEEFDKGTYGYDVAQGNTGEVISHYIKRNFIETSNPDRRIFGLNANTFYGGIYDDTYMSRLEPVNEVVEKLCRNADIGYDIIMADNGYHTIIVEGADRTDSIVFADFTMNADEITVERSVNDRANVIWAVNGGDADTATVIAVDNSETDSEGNPISTVETAGFLRREMVASTNCDVDEIQLYAKKSAEEKFNKTKITMELKDYTIFENRFRVGDKVSVLKHGQKYKKRVLSANKRYTGSSKSISITLGDIPERKPFKKLQYSSDSNQREIIDEKLNDIAKTKSGGSSSSSILSAASFEKNRLLYNGETYHVQYGINKRIMCVTKGDKYALISSTDPIDSRIEATTAVMKGLTEDWDLEFDYYGLEWADGITLDISAVMGNYSGRVRCDWGDGTVDENASHIYYNVGAVTVKVKLLDTVSGTISVNLGASQWNNSNNKLCTERYIGARAYIGGSIENVQISHGQGVTHICFGEKIKSISGHGIYQIAEGYNEMGIPPFIENISDNAYFYSGIDYIYIPESCVSIGDYAFYYNSASEIEIEEKGDTLTIGDYAFSNTADTSAVFNRVDVIRIPARVIKGGTNDIFIRCSAGTVIFGRGRTEIPEYMCRAAYASPTFSEISKRPFFVFIPKTVKTIGNQFISDIGYSEYANNPVYIICEGKWNNITKASDWDGANGGRENVTIIENDELYRSADKIINTFVKRS